MNGRASQVPQNWCLWWLQWGSWHGQQVAYLQRERQCIYLEWNGQSWPGEIPPLATLWPQAADTAIEILSASYLKAAMQTSQHADMLAHNIEVTGVAVVTSMELDCRTCWYLHRFSTGYCCLPRGFSVAREGPAKGSTGRLGCCCC